MRAYYREYGTSILVACVQGIDAHYPNSEM
jgi:hypothetical protein